MRTEICDRLGIEFPIFAFTHCRDVVAEVSRAGGFGVLGAVGFSPEQLEIELKWIDEHIGSALRHERVRLIANALGTPPADVIEQIHTSGRLVGALCGSSHQALRHKEAGLDLIIAQGYEGGGHTGEVGSLVLWPEVIDAVAPVPVLAAGGIGTGRQAAAALAMGAAGVWTGSLWLTVAEAESSPAELESYFKASSRDTVRSRSYTGKPCRMLRNAWTEAWESAETPDPLGMPLQYMVTADAVSRTSRYAAKGQDVAFNPVGQIVGRMNEVRSSREVVQQLVEEYLTAVERLESLAPELD